MRGRCCGAATSNDRVDATLSTGPSASVFVITPKAWVLVASSKSYMIIRRRDPPDTEVSMPSPGDKAKLEELSDVFLFTQAMNGAAAEEVKPRDVKGAGWDQFLSIRMFGEWKEVDANRKWHTNSSKATDEERGFSYPAEMPMNLTKEMAKMRWGMAARYAGQQAASEKGTANAMLKGPGARKPDADGRQWLQNSHLLHEVVDPQHRFGFATEDLKDLYCQWHGYDEVGQVSHFYMWLGLMVSTLPELIENHLIAKWGTAPRDLSVIKEFINDGVNYMKDASRKEYRLVCLGGKLFQENRLFDTRNSSTAHSGAGWAIYVVSPTGRWFAGPHKAGKFHHSSFLQGKPVMSAGEMQVSNGVPTQLSAKSGHYQPTLDQFANGIQALKRKGIDLSKCELLLHEGGKKVLVPALSFLTDPKAKTRYTAW
jgi:hypothetical protein